MRRLKVAAVIAAGVSLIATANVAEAARGRKKEEQAQAAAEAAVASAAFLAENATQPGVVVTESGLQYQILERGPSGGHEPYRADIVIVNYEGRTIDGEMFDSSYKRGRPSEFPVYSVIKGWGEGVRLMKKGDKFRLFVPPDLAYGETGNGRAIGPNEALVFDVELIDIIRTGLAQ